ncbi:SDR family NAD(P)-dependent oxidoreductase [Streptomyces sp. ISL-100]|uniref:SDR family NAD(P)-dependent oxidoreductase n=1 Tax=Streptomyces sp. ISL-100 TaxID=2819173 RepID=UPI001BEAE510|nr:SDR family oxidoreductase [Streptomyces sp. ISL-100]MBT2399324.1 SDR family oxidoreductase [Streptomyces sp. ISL-100]
MAADTAPRTALVTGGSRGIGRAVVERLGRSGAVVAIHYGRDAAAADEAVAAVRAAGGQAFSVRADLTEEDAVDALAAGVEQGLVEHTGSRGLDVLVNNAGVGCRADITTLTSEDIDRVFAINVKAPVFVVQRLLPLLRDGGRIVNVSSVANRIAHPHVLAYAMSKGALEAFSRSLAAQLGPRGITVNTVAPGLIETDFHRARLRAHPEDAAEAAALTAFGRLGQPEDVADAVAFLASEQARWITGERVETTGGAYL